MLSIEEENAIMNNAGSIVMFLKIFTKRFEVLFIYPDGNGGDLTSFWTFNLGLPFLVDSIFSG